MCATGGRQEGGRTAARGRQEGGRIAATATATATSPRQSDELEGGKPLAACQLIGLSR